MPKKIDSKTKAAVAAALAAGESPRSIARRFGVSRPTVARFRDELGLATPRRCPTCGAPLVAPECLACWLRSPPEKRGRFFASNFYVGREPEDI